VVVVTGERIPLVILARREVGGGGGGKEKEEEEVIEPLADRTTSSRSR